MRERAALSSSWVGGVHLCIIHTGVKVYSCTMYVTCQYMCMAFSMACALLKDALFNIVACMVVCIPASPNGNWEYTHTGGLLAEIRGGGV